jgi:excinuclease ABC subunit C
MVERAALTEKLKLLPADPGVYLMKGAQGKVIYVGKASSLKNRVRSYFHASQRPDLKTQYLVQEIVDFEYIVTHSEREALIVEDTLIKRYQPRYNVRLKDDKRYPYLKLTAEPFPRLMIARRLEADAQKGARYFGPYTSGQAVREAQAMIQRLFRIRTCTLALKGAKPARQRPCLDHYIGLCDAPCVGWIAERAYGELIEGTALFLQGHHELLIPQLKGHMEEASRNLEFERAARLRDQVRTLQKLLASQKVIDAQPIDQDAIGLFRAENSSLVSAQIFFIRAGKLIGRENFLLEAAPSTAEAEITGAFVKQYYAKAAAIPPQILLPTDIEDREAVSAWLSERAGRSVTLKVPQRGSKRQLIATVKRNAELALWEHLAKHQPRLDEPPDPLCELQRALHLENLPTRIEGFDISNIQGREAVASMVVFERGSPKKSDYRRFKIKTVEGADDFAMMAETVRRRLEHGLRERATPDGSGEKFAIFPDLILIDGGQGQLSAARKVMYELGLEKIPTIGLAKEFEHIFVENRSDPIVLPRNSPALHLLQRVRDEAHRFALTYHRLLRGKHTVQSLLDDIPGLGPRRKKLLIQRFGSVKRIRSASLDELAEVPGLPRQLAEQILKTLNTSKT